MAIICPTITAYELHDYRAQLERVIPFAERIHIDLMDGDFAPTISPPLDKIWLPEAIISDVHLMYRRPKQFLPQLLTLKPNMVIIHVEAELEHHKFAEELHTNHIKAGLAVLQDTPIESIYEVAKAFDHVLIFSGHLGYHGGQADLTVLEKVKNLRGQNTDIEISWDGGINAENAPKLIEVGVDVLNVGSFIQKAENPQQRYEQLTRL